MENNNEMIIEMEEVKENKILAFAKRHWKKFVGGAALFAAGAIVHAVAAGGEDDNDECTCAMQETYYLNDPGEITIEVEVTED